MEEGEDLEELEEKRERDDPSKILRSVFFIPSSFLMSSCSLLAYDLQFFLKSPGMQSPGWNYKDQQESQF